MSVWNFYASYGNQETKSASSSSGFTLQFKSLDTVTTDIQKREEKKKE